MTTTAPLLERKAAYPLRQPPDDTWRVLHRLASGEEPGARRQFLEALANLRDDLPLDDIADALANGDIDRVLRLIPFGDLHDALVALEESLDGLRSDAFDVGTKVAEPYLDAEQLAIRLGHRSTLGIAWQQVSETVLATIRYEGARRIQQITDETRAAVRQFVERAYVDGIHPRQIVKDLKTVIGLTTRQEGAVDRYRQALVDEGVTPARVEQLVTRRRAKLIKQRATLIARTETIRAMNEGQRASWQTLVDRGLIDPNRMEREWMAIVPTDGRTCPECEALDGARAPIGGSYGALGGSGPPEHPACRCVERLVPVQRAS